MISSRSSFNVSSVIRLAKGWIGCVIFACDYIDTKSYIMAWYMYSYYYKVRQFPTIPLENVPGF